MCVLCVCTVNHEATEMCLTGGNGWELKLAGVMKEPQQKKGQAGDHMIFSTRPMTLPLDRGNSCESSVYSSNTSFPMSGQ